MREHDENETPAGSVDSGIHEEPITLPSVTVDRTSLTSSMDVETGNEVSFHSSSYENL